MQKPKKPELEVELLREYEIIVPAYSLFEPWEEITTEEFEIRKRVYVENENQQRMEFAKKKYEIDMRIYEIEMSIYNKILGKIEDDKSAFNFSDFN